MSPTMGQSGTQINNDSVRIAREEMMAIYQRQRMIYEHMYAENMQNAVDSVLEAKKTSYLEAGKKRLNQYLSHDRIDTLIEIDLKGAGLEEVPEFVFKAKSLKILVLDNNSIKKLPKELDDLPNLKRVYWRENNLERFRWIRIPNIDGLEKLDLSNNALSRLPSGVKRLEGLKELVLDENFFEAIPVSRLKRAPFVKTISLSKSHQLELSEQRYDKIDFIEVLKVNNARLDEIHPSFYKLSSLGELQLQENQLKDIPVGISELKNLTKLSFYKNQLTSLPEDLFELDLKVIDLYYNQLEVIPETMGNLSSLEILFLAYNKIYTLPESLGNLDHLVELYLHHNRLSVLPAGLAQLDKVKVVRVNDNYLVDFPVQFLIKSQLSDLDISNNQIEQIPASLEKMPALELFTYQDNPIDFHLPENDYLGPMIIRMLEAGILCVPRVYKDEVVEEVEMN
ncbi:MAG: Leucine-rich repeat (LRR) protein [Marinoscillum sp.]|jgi:Leucine-rich repeat (LRR) protein